MSRKQCKRRIWALVNPITHATEGASYVPEAVLDKLRHIELGAIDAMRIGKGTTTEWNQLVGMLNLTETMARGGVGPEALPTCALAEAELLAAAKRYESTKRMGLTATGLEALRELYSWHDLQRTAVHRSVYAFWIKKTGDLIRSHAPEVRDVATA